MDNTSVNSSVINTEIVENANRFTEFLSSETVAPVRKSITIIPNIVADILDVALQHKMLKIQDDQYKQKVELAQRYLEYQDKNARRQFSLEVEKIHTQADTVIAEIKYKSDMELAHIKCDENTKIQKIKSEECVRIKEIQTQYQLARNRQENEKEMFKAALNESSQRFKKQMKNAEKIQAEFSKLIQVITRKISNGTATEYEYKLLEHLSLLKIQALEKSFNISEGFLDMFIRGE